MSAFSSPKVSFRSFSCYLPAALMKINPIHDEINDEQRAQVNRLNAQRSTGPVTHQGKAISSLNAVKPD
ncbi:MAG: hypothetical protein JO210_05340 [Acidobacteriaceae bacterium]|nr:hypothetical protein [Acidobacteriaceae bacterium]